MLSLILITAISADPQIDLVAINRKVNLLSQDQRVYFAIRLASVTYNSREFDRWAARWESGEGRHVVLAQRMYTNLWNEWSKDGKYSDKDPRNPAMWACNVAKARARWRDDEEDGGILQNQAESYNDEIWSIINMILNWNNDQQTGLDHTEVNEIYIEVKSWKNAGKDRIKV